MKLTIIRIKSMLR